MTTRAIARTVVYGIPAMLWLMVAGLPFYFMVQSGFKKQFDLLSNPFWKLPREWTLGNICPEVIGRKNLRSR